MPKNRIVLGGYMTVEGFHIELQEVNFETDKTSDKVALTLPSEVLDQLFEKWQAFKNGTNKEHCLILRNYFDDHPDMDYMKYFAMGAKRLEDEKSKQ